MSVTLRTAALTLALLPAVAWAAPAPISCGVPVLKPDPGVYAGSDAAAQQPKYQQQAAAIQALSAAAVIVFGHTPEKAEWENWTGVMQRPDSPYRAKYFAKELDFTDGAAFLRTCLKTVAGAQAQADTIEGAFHHARGRGATNAERLAYLPQIAAGKAWYSTIVLAEKQKLTAAGTPALKLPAGTKPLPQQTLPQQTLPQQTLPQP